MTIQGLDISHWQGKLSIEAVGRMIGAGIRFVYVKATQGLGYIDDCFENNVMMLQNTGIQIGAYHFVTNDDAGKQWKNFKAQLDKFTWQLPPALDCEAYTPQGMFAPGEAVASDTVLGLTYPAETIIDAIGRQVTIWMASQPTLKGYVYPVVYTNCGSGNIIFKTAVMKRYLLWVANWNVASPCIPKVWKGKDYFIWQDYVERDGTKYGLPPNTPVDHDVWGSLLPFPGDEPTPPPPTDEIEMTLKQAGIIYAGKLEIK